VSGGGWGGAAFGIDYGFDEDGATRALLRSPPPAEALAWAASALGAGGPEAVVEVRALRGGLSSAVHALRVALPAGPRWVVLRRWVRPDLLAEEPELAGRELRALRWAEPLAVPTPSVLAADLGGDAAGTPSLVMSCLPGLVVWEPGRRPHDPPPDAWLDGLVGALAPIHAAPVPPPDVVEPYEHYHQLDDRPPAWSRHPDAWRRAVAIAEAGTPADVGPAVFVHRDFHPGNVLWTRGRVTGVVDWPTASVGPAVVDVGHCRTNLVQLGLDVVDDLAARWERLAGATFHPWADVTAIVGMLDGLVDAPPPGADVLDAVIARAVASLAG